MAPPWRAAALGLVAIALFLLQPPVLGAFPQPATQSCDADCQAAQKSALLTLYESTHGPSWLRSNATVNGTVIPATQVSGAGKPASLLLPNLTLGCAAVGLPLPPKRLLLGRCKHRQPPPSCTQVMHSC